MAMDTYIQKERIKCSGTYNEEIFGVECDTQHTKCKKGRVEEQATYIMDARTWI